MWRVGVVKNLLKTFESLIYIGLEPEPEPVINGSAPQRTPVPTVPNLIALKT